MKRYSVLIFIFVLIITTLSACGNADNIDSITTSTITEKVSTSIKHTTKSAGTTTEQSTETKATASKAKSKTTKSNVTTTTKKSAKTSNNSSSNNKTPSTSSASSKPSGSSSSSNNNTSSGSPSSGTHQHSMPVGNMGRWFDDKNSLISYFNSEGSKWDKLYTNGEITYEEYVKNSPYGYECWSCSTCGKWTGNFKYR